MEIDRMDRGRSAPVGGPEPPADSARVLELLAERERIERELLGVIARWDAEQHWAGDGSLHPIPWLVHHGRMTRAEAAGLMAGARVVRRCERVEAGLGCGEISTSHVRLLARAARRQERLLVEHQDALVDAAASVAPEPYRAVVRRWRALADDVLADREAIGAFDGRYLHVSPTFAGTVVIDGRLDAEGGARVLAALDACAPPVGPLAQRRADALVAMAGGARSHTNVEVIVDAATLAGTGARLRAARSELGAVGPVPASVVRRLGCDATVRARDERGLALGRKRRLISRAQRRVLVERDGGCAFPGCDRPPEWTDAHHIRHWADNGASDLDNLVLLCRRHHVACHEGRWQVQRDGDGRIEARPP